MRPEQAATKALSITRSKAKMYEFDVPLEDHIALTTNPSILFSLAIGLLGDAAAAIAASDERRTTTSDALRFAAIYFDAYVQTQLNEVLVPAFGVLAAAAYYLSESPGNSLVLMKRLAQPSALEEGHLYQLVYRLLRAEHDAVDGGPYGELPSRLLTALNKFYRLESGAEPVIALADQIRAMAYEHGTDRDVLYADVSAAVSSLKVANAARTLLPEASGLGLVSWRAALLKPRFPAELWPAQRRICGAGVMAGGSALIQMPTSAGKTRATEMIIRSAFLAKRTSLAVIVAPFRALCHDIRGDLARAFFGENILLDEATDTYQGDVSFDELTRQNAVLIVTPEKLLYLLRRDLDLSSKIGLIIYDEGHLFDSPGRGVTYELLLTSLKLTVSPDARVILIPAVIQNAPAVAAWLVGDADRVVHGKDMLPTLKSIAFASWKDPRGQLRYVAPNDPDEEEFFVPRVIESIRLSDKGSKALIFPKSDGPQVGLYLGLKLVRNGPIAVFCGRKDSAAKLCKTAVDLFDRGLPMPVPAEFADNAEVSKLRALTERHLGVAASASRAADLGIFAHHASVPHGLRLCIEHAMKESLIRFVVCTSTLAQGVNLPIRYLIITSVQQGADQIMVRDFHNLIGRAGRAGMHTEGSIIFSAPAIYDGRRDWRQRWRWGRAKGLLNPENSEPCGSNILDLFR